jgi:hypothetical protein
MSELPQAESADTDAVQMALQAAHTLWSRGDTTESLRWLKRAAESASDEGADLRSLQLAKAAAELRAKLFPTASDAAPPAAARTPTQRDLSGVRPAAQEGVSREELLASSSLGSTGSGSTSLGSTALGSTALGYAGADSKPVARPEESSPSSSRSSSAPPQYVVHRPREAQRQLMGLSSTTLETARQHNGSGYASVPSWSAGSERRTSSPPPLPPPRSVDDYEELDAEPVEDSDAHSAAGWAQTAAPTWRPPVESPRMRARDADAARREVALDSSPRVATLPPPNFQPSLSSSPPPLPELSAFGDEDGDPMRPEQPTVVLPPQEEREDQGLLAAAAASSHESVSPEPAWDSDPRMSNWDSGSYGWDPRSAGWSNPSEPSQAPESQPPKLTARVHHQAVRVSFAPDSRAPGQYIVRPLREGERPPVGERIALLVALEPGVPLV